MEMQILNELIRSKQKWIPSERLMQVSGARDLNAFMHVINRVRNKLNGEPYMLQHDFWAGYRLLADRAIWHKGKLRVPIDNSTDS